MQQVVRQKQKRQRQRLVLHPQTLQRTGVSADQKQNRMSVGECRERRGVQREQCNTREADAAAEEVEAAAFAGAEGLEVTGNGPGGGAEGVGMICTHEGRF